MNINIILIVVLLCLSSQEKINSGAKPNVLGRKSPAQCATPPLVAPAWQTIGAQKASHSNAVSPKSSNSWT